ncbi:MAG TPA: ABC transporter permease [Thermoanaerobaculia bacterium]
MRVVLSMVAKDLRRRLRSPLPTLLLLAFPLIFAGLIALTFGGGEARAPKVHLLVENRDGGLVGRFLLSALGQEEVQQHVEVQAVESVGGDVGALLERRQAAALLRLPAGLSEDFVAGRPARLELIRSPAQSILPDVAEQLTTVMAEVLSSAARLLRGPLDEIRAARPPQGAGGGVTDGQVARLAVLANGVMSRARPYLLPPVVQLTTTTLPAPGGKPRAAGAPRSNSLFLLFLPGISVFSLFSLSDQMMRDVLVEARQKTLRRQLAGPLRAGRVLVAKALATAALAGLSLVFLTVLGALLAPRGVNLAGYLLLSLALVTATTGFASAMYAAARNERQGATLAAMLSLVMAFAGGAFIPLDSLPGLLRSLSPFSLIYWATRGYQRLVVNGEGLSAVLPNIAILAGVGALLLAASAPLWQRRLLRGELQ